MRIVTDDIDEAFRVFDSQNYRGKPLAPHDLLKAHHLREMHDESAAMKVAVVEAWEAVNDEDLDRLFSTFYTGYPSGHEAKARSNLLFGTSACSRAFHHDPTGHFRQICDITLQHKPLCHF